MSMTFGMNTPSDCLKDFRQKADLLSKDDLNTSLAMDCAIAAWSVVDWIYESNGQSLGYQNLRSFQDSVRNQCKALDYLQDIANSRKHKSISKYTPKVKSADRVGGILAFAFRLSFDLGADRLVFHTDNEQHDIIDTLQQALTFFDTFFTQNNIE